MYRYCSLFLCLLIVSVHIYSQRAVTADDYVQSYHKAEKYFHLGNATDITDSLALQAYSRAIAVLEKSRISNDTLLDCYLKTGILRLTAGDNIHALQSFHASIAVWKSGKQLPDSLLFQPYLYAGSIRYSMNELDSAIFYYKKAEAIIARFPSLSESERLYNKLGALNYETGDYRKSIHYFEKALSQVQEKKPLNISFVVNYKNNIGTALLKLGDYQAALDIYRDLLPYMTEAEGLKFNISTAYMGLGNYTEGLHYLHLVKHDDAEKFNGLTRAYLQTKQLDSASYYNGQSLAYFRSAGFAGKNTNYGLALRYAGDILTGQQQYAAAITAYQRALVQLLPAFNDSSITVNPVSFSGLQNFAYLFDVLTAKGNAFSLLNANHPDPSHLKSAFAAYQAALALARHVERSYSSDESKLFLKEKVNPACSNAIAIALSLYKQNKDSLYLNAAFGVAEGNKASVLQSGLQQLELTGIAGLPAALVAEEKKYKSLLAKWSVQLAQAGGSAEVTILQKKVQDVELSLATVQEKLDENPAYHQLKFDTKTADPDSIRQVMVQKDGAILSYYYTSSQLLCFYITAKETGVVSSNISTDFFTAIAGLRKQLESPVASDRQTLNDISTTLYRYLLQPVMDKISNASRLVIIPYNEISYIPFELLKDDKNGKLLLSKFAISYNYSANFLAGNKQSPHTDYNVLAVAPFAGRSNDNLVLPVLPSSGVEIANLPGKQITGPDATKSVFISLAGQYPVIHLATHAVANDRDPLGCYIEFYGEKKDPDSLHRLYENEIYNLDMKQARLVILSACETGNGQLVNGEGIVSLSRAFSYAGCKTVITSLWKADDQATAFIMKRLHVYLQQGHSKDDALQKAKLDYINNSDIDDRYKTPFYWAHLLLIGDTDPVQQAGFHWYVFALAGLLLLLVAFFVYKKNRAHKNVPGMAS